MTCPQWKIGPKTEPKIGTNNTLICLILFFKSRAQMGREKSRWIDLTLNSHFEAVIPESCRTKVRFMPKSTLLGQQKGVKKDTKRSSGPNTDLFGQTKRGAGRLDMKIGGVNNSSSFIWTLVVKKENEKRKPTHHPTPPTTPPHPPTYLKC